MYMLLQNSYLCSSNIRLQMKQYYAREMVTRVLYVEQIKWTMLDGNDVCMCVSERERSKLIIIN